MALAGSCLCLLASRISGAGFPAVPPMTSEGFSFSATAPGSEILQHLYPPCFRSALRVNLESRQACNCLLPELGCPPPLSCAFEGQRTTYDQAGGSLIFKSMLVLVSFLLILYYLLA